MPSIARHRLAWHLVARLAGGVVWVSRHVLDAAPGWAEAEFARPIESIDFMLPTGHRIHMAGMRQYVFFVEASERAGAARVHAAHLMGLLPRSNAVYAWRVGDGRVLQRELVYGREWCGAPVAGWRPGVPGAICSQVMEG